MKDVTARLRYLRIAPRKARRVAQTIQGKSAKQAETQLRFMHKSAAMPLLKLLRSAMANAQHNFQLDADRLSVRSARVDGGPALKRFVPRSRGMANPIHRRTSHVTLILSESIKSKTKNEKPKSNS